MSRANKLVAAALAGDLTLELDVRPPFELVVLNCCVTDTKDAPCASQISTSREKCGRRGQPVDLVDDDNVSGRPWYRRADLHRRLQICRPRTRHHHNGFWPMPSARGAGRRRAAGPADIAPTCGNISVGGYSSTAFSAMRSRQVVKCALGLAADAGLDEVVQALLRTTSRCKTARLTDG